MPAMHACCYLLKYSFMPAICATPKRHDVSRVVSMANMTAATVWQHRQQSKKMYITGHVHSYHKRTIAKS